MRFTLPRIIRTPIYWVQLQVLFTVAKSHDFDLARDLNPTVSDPRNFIEAVLYEISKNIVAFAIGDDIATCDKTIRLIASASSMTGRGGITYSDCDAQ